MHWLCLISFDTVFGKECVFFIGVTSELSLFIRLRVLGFEGFFITCWAFLNFRLDFLYCDYIFLTRVFVFVFNIFYSNIFSFYFFKLICWNWNIRQIMYVCSSPRTPVSSTYMSVNPIKSIGSKDDFYCDWISEFSLGRR